jgi:hypothetical protein
MNVARVERLRTGIESVLGSMVKLTAEAAMIRKIAADLLAKANKLDETAAYQKRQIADWEAMIRDEEERA